MATNFPTSLDSFTNPISTDAQNAVTVPHADQHANANDAIEALQAKVGIDSSADASSLDYRIAAQEAHNHDGTYATAGHNHSGTYQAALTAWQIKTTTYSIVAGDRIMANSTSAAFTITLPASPSAGDRVIVSDYAGMFATNNVTIGRNTKNIMGLAEDLVLNIANQTVTLDYIDVTQGWRIV